MSAICKYEDCFNKRLPGSHLSFFQVPSDEKGNMRKIWLRHCTKPPFNKAKNLFICENHFKVNDLLVYGTIKKLKSEAIPLPSQYSTCKCNAKFIDFCCRITAEQFLGEFSQPTVYKNNNQSTIDEPGK